MSYTTPADVAARWRPGAMPLPDDESVIQVWIDDAELLIRARYPELDYLVDYYGETAEATVKLVTARIVLRSLSSTPGSAGPVLREQIGDTSIQYETPGPAYSLTAEEVALLDGRFGAGRWLTAPRLTGGPWYDDWQGAGEGYEPEPYSRRGGPWLAG